MATGTMETDRPYDYEAEQGGTTTTSTPEKSGKFNKFIKRAGALLVGAAILVAVPYFYRDHQADQAEGKLKDEITLLKKEKDWFKSLEIAGFTHVVDVRPSLSDPSKMAAVVSENPSDPAACTQPVFIEGTHSHPNLVFDATNADNKQIPPRDDRVADGPITENHLVQTITKLAGPNC